MTGDTTFLVERYMAGLRRADVDLLARRLADATAELRAEGRDIRWHRSLAVPEDETCLCIFSAATRADVEEANRRADAGCERVLAVIEVAGASMPGG